MTSLVETIAPDRLGRSFRWLMSSSWLTNLGDGMGLAAGPLLVAAQTNDPGLVALALLLQNLPWLVFGLVAGAMADRVDRRVLAITVNLIRAGVLVLLSVSVLTGTVSIALVLLALFAHGTAEVFADTAVATLLPTLLPRDELAIGNARLSLGFVTMNQLVGPPIGAALFVVGHAWPFVGQAVLVCVGALLVSRIVLPAPTRSPAAPHVRRDIAEGFRWVRHHAAVRTLILTIFTFNITFGAAWSVLVLYARDRLGLGAVGYGLLTTTSAIGGVFGGLAYGWITRRITLGNIMRIGLIIETLTHLSLALTTTPAIAVGIFFVFGAHAFIWGTTSATVRQRAVPNALQGRVSSVNSVGVFGGLVVGAGIGGALAQRWGVTAPFWFAFAGSGLFVVLIWRQLTHIALDPVPEDA